MTTTERDETITAAAVFDRHADLTPPEYAIDDAEPFSVQYARVQTQVELWEAVRRYEQQNRSLDAEAAAIERALDRAEQAEALDPAEDRERAERRAEQAMADRRSRVHLWAAQRGLRYVVTASTDHSPPSPTSPMSKPARLTSGRDRIREPAGAQRTECTGR